MSEVAAPNWFVSIAELGRASASEMNSKVGESYPVTVLSVPIDRALLHGSSGHGIVGFFR